MNRLAEDETDEMVDAIEEEEEEEEGNDIPEEEDKELMEVRGQPMGQPSKRYTLFRSLTGSIVRRRRLASTAMRKEAWSASTKMDRTMPRTRGRSWRRRERMTTSMASRRRTWRTRRIPSIRPLLATSPQDEESKQ